MIFTALPAGCRQVPLDTVFAAEGRARLAEAARVLGSRGAAAVAARRMGRYELDEQCRRTLGLAGVELAAGGEIPALSPERWADLPVATTSEGEVLGLLLTPDQERSFRRFLARNHVSDPDPARAIELARHFFTEPASLVIR